jgi:peptidoglycan/LPS O-acetylase OafA/YrhL
MKIIIPLTTALLFAITGILELAHEQVSPFTSAADYLIEGAFTAALATGAAALWQLRERGNRNVWTLAAFGHAVLLLAAGATFARGQESLDPAFPVGVLAITAAFLAASVQDVRGRLVARGAGLALLAGWAITVGTNSSLALAAGWTVVALLEQRRRGEERLDTPAVARA